MTPKAKEKEKDAIEEKNRRRFHNGRQRWCLEHLDLPETPVSVFILPGLTRIPCQHSGWFMSTHVRQGEVTSPSIKD